MKYLCLAYGNERDWERLPKEQQDELLAQDEVLRQRGDIVAAVATTATTVRAWDGTPTATSETFAHTKAPLAGFSIIEAPDLEEAVRLVADTPCARAKGAVELRPIDQINEAFYQRDRDIPLTDVLQSLRSSHHELLAALDRMSEADLFKAYTPAGRGPDSTGQLIDWVIGDSYEHYDEHRATMQRLLGEQESER